MCSLHRWVGIETQRDVIHCPECNVKSCVLCYGLFHSDFDIVNMEDSISTIFKRLKTQKNCQILYFVWNKFLRNAYTIIFVTMGSILP